MLGSIGSALGSAAGAAGISAGGSLLSDAFNAWQAHEARTASEDMFRRRYRIMVHDLKAAGLNPMLAYMKDAGTPPVTSPAHATGDLGAVINQARTSSAQSNLMKMQEQAVAAQTAKTDAETDLTIAQAAKTRRETLDEGQYSAESSSRTYKGIAEGQAADAMAATRNSLRPAELLRATSEAEIARAGIQHALNLEAAEFTEWKRDFAVYLDDVLKMAQSTNQVSQAFSIGKVLRLIDEFRQRAPGPQGKGPVGPSDWKGVYRGNDGKFRRDSYGPSGESR